MANEAVKLALMAAAHQHKVKTSVAKERARMLRPRAWDDERKAYILSCILYTIRYIAAGTPARTPWDEVKTTNTAVYLAHSAHRIATNRAVKLSRIFDLILFPCLVCGKRATQRVGMRGYCRTHRKQAADDCVGRNALFDRTHAERERMERDKQIEIMSATKHHKATGRKAGAR